MLLGATVGGVLVAGTAHALPVATGSFNFSGDPKDYVSQGKSYSFSTSNGDAFSAEGDTSVVNIAVDAGNGNRWFLEFDAPSGRVLAPGSYTAAQRPLDKGTGPGLELYGNSRACGQLTG